MLDIIQLLPDSIANQIAAGEVVQRPASVVKELLENSIDAGADNITLILKEAGKHSIQVIDNGKGMSETDARLAFERHATSKIKETVDLYKIQTMGFRGEALASICAVAEVELKTKRETDKLGVQIKINGSKFISQQAVPLSNGSNFTVKNLFFNVPVRRNFLKSDSVELRHITNEFIRVALAYPEISFKLYNNDKLLQDYRQSNFAEKIIQIFGDRMKKKLHKIESKTSLIEIDGYIGDISIAKKQIGEQFFFTNGRYIKHPYFHKAISLAYDKIVQPNHHPSYFLKFRLNPEHIDVNIHPTKTEVKFKDERAIWQIINSVVKQVLGKYHIMPSLYFDKEKSFEIPTLRKDTSIEEPKINIDSSYNPFDNNKKEKVPSNWETLYNNFENENNIEETNYKINIENKQKVSKFLIIESKYILTNIKSGIVIINIKRALENINFEKVLKIIKNSENSAEKIIFEEEVSFNTIEIQSLKELLPELKKIGFEIEVIEEEKIKIKSIPVNYKKEHTEDFLHNLLDYYNNSTENISENYFEHITMNILKAKYKGTKEVKIEEEIEELVNSLFILNNPNYTYDGRKVIHLIEKKEIKNFF